MMRRSGTKINKLLQSWPPGTVAVQSWLERQGVTRQLADAYCRTGWLDRVGRGAYVRTGDRVEWAGALYAVQTQLGLPVHAGGKTALQLHGYVHFLPLGKGQPVTLFANPGTKLPTWFVRHDWGARLRYTATRLFPDEQTAITDTTIERFAIRVAAPERAIMELLHEVPLGETFDEALLLMEGLTTLRPMLVQTLLEQCNSVKVKRLFLYLAEACNHAWTRKVELANVDLGRGNRAIVKGGKLDPKYRITVPAGSLTPGTLENAP